MADISASVSEALRPADQVTARRRPRITYAASVYSTSSASTYTTSPTTTPAPFSLILAFVVSCYASSPSIPTGVTAHGVTLTNVPLPANDLSTTHLISLWAGNAGAAPTSAAAVASQSGTTTGGAVIEFEVTDAVMDGNVLNAIDSLATATGTGTTGTVTLGLSSGVLKENVELSFWLHLANEVTTPRSNWTETSGADGNFNSPASGVEGQFRNDVLELTASATWAGNVLWRGLAVEIHSSGTVEPAENLKLADVVTAQRYGDTNVGPEVVRVGDIGNGRTELVELLKPRLHVTDGPVSAELVGGLSRSVQESAEISDNGQTELIELVAPRLHVTDGPVSALLVDDGLSRSIQEDAKVSDSVVAFEDPLQISIIESVKVSETLTVGLFLSAVVSENVKLSDALVTSLNPLHATAVASTIIVPTPTALFSSGEVGVIYDVQDITSMFQDTAGTVPAVVDGPVGRINDLSGGNRHALQATAGSRPTLKQDHTGYYLLGDGTADFLRATFTIAQPITRISLFDQGASWTDGDAVFGGGSGHSCQLYQTSATPKLRLYSGALAGDIGERLGLNSLAIVNEVHNGASSSLTVNQDTPASINVGTTAPNGITLLANALDSGLSVAKIYGVVMINRLLTATEKEDVQAWLTKRFTRVVVVDGDSNSLLHTSSRTSYGWQFIPNASPTAYVQGTAIGGTGFHTNPDDLAVSAARLANIDARIPVNKRGRQYVYFAWWSNNFPLGGVYPGGPQITAAEAAAAVAEWLQDRKTAGVDKTCIGTLVERTDSGQNNSATRGAYNTIIAAPGWIGANNIDCLVDFAAEATMGAVGASTNTTYFETDLAHIKTAGQALLEPVFRAAINGLAMPDAPLDENVKLSDVIAASLDPLVTLVSEHVKLSETLSASYGLGTSLVEHVKLSDTSGTTLDPLIVSVSESIKIIDTGSLQTLDPLQTTGVEQIKVSDSVQASMLLFAVLAENVKLSELTISQLDPLQTIFTENVKIDDIGQGIVQLFGVIHVTDTVQAEIIADTTLSRQVGAENIKVDDVGQGIVQLFGVIRVTDTVQAEIVTDTSLSRQVTAENARIDDIGQGLVQLFGVIRVTDTVFASLGTAGLSVTLSENVEIADAVDSNAEVGENESICVEDFVSASLSAAANLSREVTAENARVTDVINVSLTPLQTTPTAEPIRVTDTVFATLGAQVIVVETVHVTEVLVVSLTLLEVLSTEPVKVLDTVFASLNPLQALVIESVIVTDALSVSVGMLQVLATESTRVAEASLETLDPLQTLSAETVEVTEAVSSSLETLQALALEALRVSDSASPSLSELFVTLNESMRVTDTLSALVGSLATATEEMVRVADVVSASINPLQAAVIVEPVLVSESAAAGVTPLLPAIAAEPVRVVDGVSAAVTPLLPAEFVESVRASDAVQASLAELVVFLAEGVRVSEEASASLMVLQAISTESVRVADALSASMSLLQATVTESVSASDAVFAGNDLITLQVETTRLSDQHVVTLDPLQESSQESVRLAEALAASIDLVALPIEQVLVSESVEVVPDLTVNLAENVRVIEENVSAAALDASDLLRNMVTVVKVIEDLMAQLDTLEVSLTESLAIVDAVTSVRTLRIVTSIEFGDEVMSENMFNDEELLPA